MVRYAEVQEASRDGVPVVGGNEDEIWQFCVILPQAADHPKAIQTRHIYIQKHQLRFQPADQLDRLQTVGTPCNYFNFGEIAEKVGELIAG